MKKYLPGLRIVKTVVAVFICLLFFYSLGYYKPLYAVISCVLMMRHSSDETKTIGYYRMKGTLLGGFVSYLTLLAINQFNIDTLSMWGPFVMSFSLFVTLMICKIFDEDPYMYSMSGVVLLITLISHAENTSNLFAYVFVRTAETLVGLVIAFVVNRYFKLSSFE